MSKDQTVYVCLFIYNKAFDGIKLAVVALPDRGWRFWEYSAAAKQKACEALGLDPKHTRVRKFEYLGHSEPVFCP